jgi:hypothetical protein
VFARISQFNAWIGIKNPLLLGLPHTLWPVCLEFYVIFCHPPPPFSSTCWRIFLTTLSVSTIYSVEWQNGWWMMNWEGLGKERSRPNRDNTTPFVWRDWGKPKSPQSV